MFNEIALHLPYRSNEVTDLYILYLIITHVHAAPLLLCIRTAGRHLRDLGSTVCEPEQLELDERGEYALQEQDNSMTKAGSDRFEAGPFHHGLVEILDGQDR